MNIYKIKYSHVLPQYIFAELLKYAQAHLNMPSVIMTLYQPSEISTMMQY